MIIFIGIIISLLLLGIIIYVTIKEFKHQIKNKIKEKS